MISLKNVLAAILCFAFSKIDLDGLLVLEKIRKRKP